MSYIPEDPIAKNNLVLDLISKRQLAIGANLTNMHTPGYVRQDVNFDRYLGPVESSLETKLSKKIGVSPLIMQVGGEVNPTNELLTMQKNMLFYTLTTRRVSNVIQELKTVAQLGR